MIGRDRAAELRDRLGAAAGLDGYSRSVASASGTVRELPYHVSIIRQRTRLVLTGRSGPRPLFY